MPQGHTAAIISVAYIPFWRWYINVVFKKVNKKNSSHNERFSKYVKE